MTTVLLLHVKTSTVLSQENEILYVWTFWIKIFSGAYVPYINF